MVSIIDYTEWISSRDLSNSKNSYSSLANIVCFCSSKVLNWIKSVILNPLL